jgi:hypothetical protein
MLLRSGNESKGDWLPGRVFELHIRPGIQDSAVLEEILPLINIRLTGKGRKGRIRSADRGRGTL